MAAALVEQWVLNHNTSTEVKEWATAASEQPDYWARNRATAALWSSPWKSIEVTKASQFNITTVTPLGYRTVISTHLVPPIFINFAKKLQM